MPQFLVYQNKNAQSKKAFPLLLDIQTNLLNELSTTVVVPLAKLSSSQPKIMAPLTPVLTIDKEKYLMLTPQLAGIPRKELGKPVANVEHEREAIITAMDFLLSGI